MNERLVKPAAKLHGYRIYKRLLSKTPFWSEDRRELYSLERLKRTLVRAAEGTEYYRSVFRDAGFDPRADFKSASDLRKLPLLKKQDVRERRESLTDKRYSCLSTEGCTSGATGEPLRFLWNESHLAFDAACVFRHQSWAGYAFHDRVAALRHYVPARKTDPLWRFDRLQNILYLSAYHLTPGNCEEYVQKVLEFRPVILRGYASSLTVFSEYAYRFRDRFDFVKGVYTSSETLLPSERETIEKTFGPKLYDWYGMGEPALVITECEQHEGMHINWEYGYGELLPSDDLPPDEFRLVTTSFHNPVMPFIRYDTGDVVRLFDSPRNCPCGRNMPLVRTVAGRKDECVITPDGRRLPSVNFYTVFRQYSPILRFQIVQYGRTEIVVKVNLRPNAPDVNGMFQALRRDLVLRLGDGIDIQLEVAQRFITNADGKTLPIIRKLGTKSSEEREEYLISSQTAWQREREGQSVYKLDWNESECVPSRAVFQVLRQAVERDPFVCWYPDAASGKLLTKIADYVAVPEELILLTHGSDLAMELLASCFVKSGDKVLVVAPTYDNFRAVVEHRGASVENFIYRGTSPFPLEDFLGTIQLTSPRLIYLSNPNNPIGYSLDRPTLEAIAALAVKLSSILVVDEAYYEFCGTTMVPSVAQYNTVAVLRSFSKAFGLAGLRLGFVVAAPGIIRVLKGINNPKSVTMFSKIAAEAALDDIESAREHVEEVRKAKEILYAFFDEHKIPYFRSQGNFVLFAEDRARELVAFLESRNIFVRDRSQYFDGVGHVRVTVGGLKSAQVFLEAMVAYRELTAIGSA